jgi:hypothetical protein
LANAFGVRLFVQSLAAVVIFISWVISNSFVTALEEDAQNMDAVQSEQTQVRQFSSLPGTIEGQDCSENGTNRREVSATRSTPDYGISAIRRTRHALSV